MSDKVKHTLKCMMVGSAIYNVILFVASLILFIIYYQINKKANSSIIILKNEICVVIGFICNIIYLYFLAKSLVKALDSNDEKYAKTHIIISTIIRFVVFCVLLVVIINENTFGISGGLMFALSMLGVKIGSYTAPLFDKKIK